MILYLDGQGLDEQGLDAGAQIRRLGWHAIRYEGGIAFPGDQLLRLSMDLGTGTAGIMLSLAPGAELPFPGPAIAVPGEPSQGSRLVTVRR
jgi:hypothetical protein